ncbi:MAG: hypothetical protein RMY28_036375 [Nostoc sp. ChiSLP01]|nr:hypothetical protein [Nostoc sp. CmiSLP01]MDZ8286357.1 hypothetical protein [Nostoc sp. ChiSLP01]
MAEQLCENPGVKFLMECWADDPASADRDREAADEVWAVENCNCRRNIG